MDVQVMIDGKVYTASATETPKPAILAAHVAALDDEGQADFFEALARIFASWGRGKSDVQLSFIAGHMKRCACVTDTGRDFVRDLAGWLA
jgi:hypothetical protein